MDGLVSLMKSLGGPDVTSELKQTIACGEIAGNRSVDQLAQEENEVLTELFSDRVRVGL